MKKQPAQRVRIAAWMSAALIVSISLSACSQDEPALTATPPLSPAEPRRGGVYRIASPYDAISLDPAVANGVEDRWLCGTLLFNRLYSYGADGTLYPDLAVDFPTISPDGLTLTIHLRSGVRFHNGREMTADDVKFTFERALDPYTVQVKLKKPLAAFPAVLSLSTYGIVPREEVLAAGSRWGSEVVIGTGPFKLVEWEMGQQLRLTRHEAYFRSGLPYLDEVHLSFNVVAPVALDRWKRGEVEFAWFSETTDERRQLRDDAVLAPNLRVAPSLVSSRILFNESNRHIRDVRVRKAIASAVNPAAVAGELGFSEDAMGLLSPLMPQFDPDFKSADAFDPERAKRLLADAGYPDGIADFIIFSREPTLEVERICTNLREIGIETQLITGDFESIRNRIQSGDVAIDYVSRRLDYADAYAEFEGYLDCKPGEVSFLRRLCDTRVSERVETAERLPMNAPERTAIYRDLQRKVVNDDVSQVIVKWVQVAGLGRSTIRGDAMHPSYGLPVLESAWLVQS